LRIIAIKVCLAESKRSDEEYFTPKPSLHKFLPTQTPSRQLDCLRGFEDGLINHNRPRLTNELRVLTDQRYLNFSALVLFVILLVLHRA